MNQRIVLTDRKPWTRPALGKPDVSLADVALTQDGKPGDGGTGQNHKS
ncbi:hypothetical protein A6F68_00884 [Tsuneonella dongtanensis]|uniref:Uncharacterized protein n=1 Tax=Tsuneonella dongtanensis TaxID=692370 RepID=A0A1B2AB69_9SPHN|nr:hypothetical protein [Tsuneonella dongtanensis]ANY19410.1 hypothetical protein A6F68_00884 [Tsuneonella dongtanensis]